MVDGFCVANALRDREPAKFKFLTTIPVRFRFSDKDTELEAEVTLIDLNPRGEVIAVRSNALLPCLLTLIRTSWRLITTPIAPLA